MSQILVKRSPASVTDFFVNWVPYLQKNGNTTIVASTWAVDDDFVVESTGFSNTKTAVRLRGGVSGKVYELTNLITTASGLQEPEKVQLRVL